MTKMRDWLFIKQPKCEISYFLNNQNAKNAKLGIY